MSGRPGMRRAGHVPSGGPGGYTARMNLRAASVLLVLVLAAFPGRPYLEAAAAEARAMGHDAARIAARRPLRGSFSSEPR